MNYKQEINANIDGGIALEEVEVVAIKPNATPAVAGENSGQQTDCKQLGSHSQQLRRAQPPAHHATLYHGLYHRRDSELHGPDSYGRPEYGLTQDRRMAYDIRNDKRKLPDINTRRQLDATRFNLDINDSVPVPDPRRIYSVLSKVIIADYTHPTYEAEWKMTTCKIKRPLQFLEFSFPRF